MPIRKPLRPPSLLLRTVRKLRADKRSLTQLSQDTGLPFYWLRQMRQGRVRSPGVVQTERLFIALHKRNLKF